MMAAEKPKSFAALAATLAAQGYYPVPIPAGCKGPTISGWPALRITPESAAEYFNSPDMLVGVLHINLMALDIDVYDAALSAEIVAEAMRRWPGALERIGQAPKSAIFLRMDEPGYKLTSTDRLERDGLTAQVEVRSVSRQIVAYGRHPDTGAPYRWPRGELWATPHEDLPEARREDVQEFRDWCQRRIEAWAGVEARSAPPAPGKVTRLDTYRRDDKPSEAAFLAALQHIPASVPYDDWLTGLMGIHDFYDGSAAGLSRAHEWSSPYAHYTAREVDQKWRSFEVGKGRTYRSVMALAKANGADLREIGRMDRAAPQGDALDGFEKVEPNPFREMTEEEREANAFDTTRVSLDDLNRIPPRRWIYGRKLLRGFCSVLAAPGGTSKSAWAAAVARDIAMGENTLHDAPHAAMPVWIYNLEDPRDETLRKLDALRRAKGLTADGLGNLIVTSGRDRALIVAEEVERGVYVARPDVDLLIEACKREGVGLLIVDPAVRAHRLPENDNKAIDLMMDQFARIAHEANIAVLLIHHTKKGFVSGEADSFRGASAMTSAARVALTMQAMSKDEAADLNVPEAERRFYVRIENAKANLAPPPEKAEWIRLQSQDLDNGDDEYPGGDNVQVVTPWEPPNAFDGIGSKMEEIFARISRGCVTEDGSARPYSMRRNSGDRWVVNAILPSFEPGEKTEAQCMAIAKNWLERDLIGEKKERDPVSRREVTCVYVKNDGAGNDG